MASLNKVVLIGHLTGDPELKKTPSDISFTSFSIGVQRRYVRGESQAQSDFINIIAWRNTAEFITKFFKKGNAICICGYLQTRQWTANDGSKRYATEVVAEEASFIEKKAGDMRSDDMAIPSFSTGDVETSSFSEVDADNDLPF